jgi:hypothetical protein
MIFIFIRIHISTHSLRQAQTDQVLGHIELVEICWTTSE